QTCALPISTAASRSASSKTMKGALPPSSIDTFLIVDAVCSISTRPTSVDPVKLNLRTIGLLVISPPISEAEPVTTEKTPSGTPASCAPTASASAEYGVCVAGFTTMGQRAASAAPPMRLIIADGKFHGVMAAHTPTGSFTTTIRRSAEGAGIVSPYARLPSSANHSKYYAA